MQAPDAGACLVVIQAQSTLALPTRYDGGNTQHIEAIKEERETASCLSEQGKHTEARSVCVLLLHTQSRPRSVPSCGRAFNRNPDSRLLLTCSLALTHAPTRKPTHRERKCKLPACWSSALLACLPSSGVGRRTLQRHCRGSSLRL